MGNPSGKTMPYKDANKRRACVYARRQRNIDKAFKYMMDGCWVCEEDDRDCLDFHHINPEHKKFRIKNGMTYGWEKTQAELDKCILVCANCHRKLHATMRKV